MIWLAGWIVGEAFVSLFLFVWGRETSNQLFGALSGHPIRSAKSGSRISLASAFRVLSAPPRYDHLHTRDRGGGAQTIILAQSRGGCTRP